MFMDIVIDALADAVLDAAKLLPFLLAAYLLVEWLEHHSSEKMGRLLGRSRAAGPAAGALLGCIPQCGFSVLTANLYAGGLVSLGTLLAVFLSTSDEAVLILLAHPDSAGTILRLIGCKIVIALIWGYLADFALSLRGSRSHREPHDLCGSCGCGEHHGILRPALNHTVKLFFFLIIFNFILNVLLSLLGEEGLASLLLGGSWAQPLLTAAIGLIPNCAASVLITELYLAGGIRFGSAVAGLCSGAGVGLAVLFRVDRNRKKCVQILLILYAIAAVSGMGLELLGV